MEQIKDYYIRDVDIEYKLKNLEILIRQRSMIFLKSREEVVNEEQQKVYDEWLEYYNTKIKELLKL